MLLRGDFRGPLRLHPLSLSHTILYPGVAVSERLLICLMDGSKIYKEFENSDPCSGANDHAL